METLLAIGTLAVGLLFIGGTFMTGIYFATVSTERTVASVVAEEAFAKMLLDDPNVAGLSATVLTPYEQVGTLADADFIYPSTSETSAGQYSWAALCRRTNASSDLVQFTVFVCRKAGAGSKYWMRVDGAAPPRLAASTRPRPVRVSIVQDTAGTAEVGIVDAVATDRVDERGFINDGASIVDEATGQIYRVLSRPADRPDTIILDRPWVAPLAAVGGAVWVVPPAISGGRNPVVGVYQKTFRIPGTGL